MAPSSYPLPKQVNVYQDLCKVSGGNNPLTMLMESLVELPRVLAPENIHCWVLPLSAINEALPMHTEFLSTEEHLRASRFLRDVDKRRFIASRGALRYILGHFLQTRPIEVALHQSASGKPILINSNIHFNLSHSHEWVAMAFSTDGPIGIDIEYHKPDFSIADIASAFVHPQESLKLKSEAHEELEKKLYLIWVRKEAYLKAMGVGLPGDMRSHYFIDSTVSADVYPHTDPTWTIQDIDAPLHYSAALCYRNRH